MKTTDPALSLTNTRLLAAVYFALLAVIANILIDTLFYALGFGQLVPTFKALILAAIVAAFFGALFGEKIIHAAKPYYLSVFLWAFLMVLIAQPFYNLGFLYLLESEHPESFINVSWKQFFYLYLFVSGYSFILIGLWVAILAGIAALYLRAFLVYYLLSSLYRRPKPVSTERQPPVQTVEDEQPMTLPMEEEQPIQHPGLNNTSQ